MKLLRMRTLGMFGIGFLAGSAAGRGPWEKTQASMDQLKGKVSGTMDGGSTNGGGQYGSTSSNGIEGQRGGQGQPQMTEM
jgi:secreted trypsin-like serine protease